MLVVEEGRQRTELVLVVVVVLAVAAKGLICQVVIKPLPQFLVLQILEVVVGVVVILVQHPLLSAVQAALAS